MRRFGKCLKAQVGLKERRERKHPGDSWVRLEGSATAFSELLFHRSVGP